ncbi:MAG: tetratricopeptide repeat protein [Verrucomicrobiota bacterium]|jgi:hypothetical protein|nr:tetratricopeptide repeat protein [Verrucomicrobiota bacterium]
MIRIFLPFLLLFLSLSVLSAEKELPKNFESLKTLAEKGDARAQLILGYMYQIGEDPIDGGPQEDYQEAVKWFRKAAQQGIARAQHTLGLMYYLGQGAKQDQMLAYAWVSVSVHNGYESVKATKRLFAEDMTSDRIAKAEVLAQEMIKGNPELIKK